MSSENKQILIVDDETVIVEAISKMCKSEGFITDESHDAETALEKISSNKYELIVCDIMLPQMDGFQLLDELSKMQLDTPVIMITGFSTLENAVRSLSMGAIDFIPKPFTFEEIISSIKRGIKFHKIKSASNPFNSSRDSEIAYVPCPSKYLKLGYTSWVKEDSDGSCLIGILDIYLKTIESFSTLELMEPEEDIYQGSSCIKVISEEFPSPVLSPLSGKILERNEKVITTNYLVEKDPYFEGWIYRIIPENLEYEKKYLTPCSSD